MNIYIVSSPGGHLNETLSMVEAFEGCDVYLITLNFPNMKGISFDCVKKIYILRLFFDYSVKFGLPVTLLVGMFTMVKAFIAHRPHMIFSTGSEIALPAFVLGKFIFGAKVVYVECFTRIKTLSLTAKIVCKFSDLFLVQWKELADIHEKAQYQGRLI
jgi:beta-1,4-N-acetylglucosaminyltransferase